MSFSHLPEDQARRAEQLFDTLKSATEADLHNIAELLASKPDDKLFGETKFQLRGLVQKIGANALQAAAEQRKKGDPKVPA